MKRIWILILAAALWLACAGHAGAYRGEPEGFGDMRWGDAVKTVSERYAVKYLEDTVAGGALYAVNFTDFTEQMGIQGPLVVTAAFDKERLVQINVPLLLETEAETERAFAAYTAFLENNCGNADEKTADFALWLGKKTTIYVEKTNEGLLVCFLDAKRMGKHG